MFQSNKTTSTTLGKYQIIAYINVGGYFCALGYDGKVFNMNKTWQEMYTENKNILNSVLFMIIITEHIDNKIKKVIRLTESDLHKMINEAVKVVIKENDDFIGHGYKTTSNYGGKEIQISDSGDGARIKYPNGEISDWMEIEFDENGVAYVITLDGEEERLDEYMRFRY